jgi:hypothetical protein
MPVKRKKVVRKKPVTRTSPNKKIQSRKFVLYFFKSKQGGGVCIYKNPNVRDPREQQRLTFKSRKEANEVCEKLVSKFCQEPVKGLNKPS